MKSKNWDEIHLWRGFEIWIVSEYSIGELTWNVLGKYNTSSLVLYEYHLSYEFLMILPNHNDVCFSHFSNYVQRHAKHIQEKWLCICLTWNVFSTCRPIWCTSFMPSAEWEIFHILRSSKRYITYEHSLMMMMVLI